MKVFGAESFLEKASLLLFLGNLVLLTEGFSRPACAETLEEFCCRQNGKIRVEKCPNQEWLRRSQKYCNVKGIRQTSNCKNLWNVTIGQLIPGTPLGGGALMLSGRSKKMGPRALARAMEKQLESENFRMCIFGTEPWCIKWLQCSKATLPPPNQNPPTETDNVEEVTRFCRKFDSDWKSCREQPLCVFDCKSGACESQQSFKDSGCCRCSKHCYDPCGCKSEGCEYSVADGSCRTDPKLPGRKNGTTSCPAIPPSVKSPVLKCNLADFPNNTCMRPGPALHSVGGVICQSGDVVKGVCDKDGGKDSDHVIIALNMNACDKDKFEDEYGIVHKPEIQEVRQDPFNVGRNSSTDAQTFVRDKNGHERFVYGGNETMDAGKCLSHAFDIKKDGRYLLNVKVADYWYNEEKKRRFNILLDKILVIPELDVLKFTPGVNRGMNIFVNFQVKQDGSILHIQGFCPVSFVGPTHKLSVCPGSCSGVDNTFQLSAFSVIKLKGQADNETDCSSDQFKMDACGCLKGKCDYDGLNSKCVQRNSGCNMEKLKANEGDCLRAGAYYVQGGSYCRNTVQRGNCSTGKTTFAVNANGETYKSSTGIEYVGEYTIADKILDNGGNRVGATTGRWCNAVEGATYSDTMYLYSTVVHGRKRERPSSVPDGDGCLSYPIPLCEEGRYELSIKTVESYWNHRNIRRFNVYLDNYKILPEVDISLNGRCKATEFIILLEFSPQNSQLQIQGHPIPIPITDQTYLKFCHGKCNYVQDTAFQFSAFSLVKLGERTGSSQGTEECYKYAHDICACKNNATDPVTTKCEFNAVTNRCVQRKSKCTLCDIGGDECSRAHTWYATAGVLCRNNDDKDKGNCREGEIITELNLGVGTAGQSRPMGRSLSKARVKEEEDCVSFPIPLTKDGIYELRFLLGNFTQHSVSKGTFAMTFNENYIVREVDVVKLTNEYRPVAKLNINFRVSGGGKTLHMKGHPNTKIKKGISVLDVCLGLCNNDNEANPDEEFWMLNSYRVIRILQPDEPEFDTAVIDNRL